MITDTDRRNALAMRDAILATYKRKGATVTVTLPPGAWSLIVYLLEKLAHTYPATQENQ